MNRRGFVIGGLMVAVMLCAGCAQNTEPVQDQRTGQGVTTPADANQRTTTEGSEAYGIYVINNYQGKTLAPPTAETGLLDFDTNGEPDATSAIVQSGLNVTVNVGSTAATPTGATATASGSGQQTANANQSTTAEQKPETTLTIPVTVAWAGGSASGQGTAARGDATASQVADLKSEYTKLQAEADKLKAMLDAIGKTAASQPVAPPPGN